MIVMAKQEKMEPLKLVGLVLTLIMTVRASAIAERPATNPDFDLQPEDYVPAARRIWDAGENADDTDGQATMVQASYGLIPSGDFRRGGWSAAAPPAFGEAYGEDGAGLWDVVASESEARGVYSGERMRWMPSKSRYRQRKQPAPEDSPAEIPLQEHQRRQRLQLQQQLLKRAPEGRRGALQLENLGGGILEDVDDDLDEPEEPEEEEPELRQPVSARSRLASPPQPFSKLPALRPPIGANEPTPGKTPSAADLKSILKMSGPLSLSEILQGKNLSLEELLKGSRVALSAVAQSATTETAEIGTRTEQRRRRLKPIGTRPQLKRRRPTTPPEFNTEVPSTTVTEGYTTTMPATTEATTTTTTVRSTSTSTTPMPNVEMVITTIEEPEATTVAMKMEEPSQSSPWFTSSGDPARDILDIILQEDENDGPSLAEVLSSRNMTVADLIEQRERASGRSTITSLFPPPSSIVKEWHRRKGRGDERKERAEESKKVEDSRRGRKYAHFDLTEADWEEASMEKAEKTPVEKEDEEIDDQQFTQTRNTYQVISSNDAVVHLPKSTEMENVKPSLPIRETLTHDHPIPEEPKPTRHIPNSEIKISQIYIPSPKEVPTYKDEDHRPIIRTRVAAPMVTSTEEVLANEEKANRDTEIQNTQRTIHEEYGHEAPLKINGLPEGVKSAIIASTSLLGIALLIFLAIFAAFRYRQWRRRRGMGPYLCAAVLEAAAGARKGKGPKIIKKGKTKEKGWGDTFDSAQERLWRTLRRGRCRFYDRENGQM
ncbi:uncharacterized protein LOC124153855 [Ischnura elegans]|uniref:uncharacterized protein LOC124153855 n=1 Tax=Ischnura elegans TaxID=197161 RepID=UPI001ED878B5|nr:uncharacterized protein LOC124153855 [Ischnura elegans]